MRVVNPGWGWWPSWLDVYHNLRLLPKIQAPVLVMHVSRIPKPAPCLLPGKAVRESACRVWVPWSASATRHSMCISSQCLCTSPQYRALGLGKRPWHAKEAVAGCAKFVTFLCAEPVVVFFFFFFFFFPMRPLVGVTHQPTTVRCLLELTIICMARMQGTKDEVVDISAGRALHAAARNPAEPLWIEGCDHQSVELSVAYLPRMRRFIQSCIRK